MAKIGTLVTFPNYYRGQKALITASLSGAQYDLEIVKEEDCSALFRVPLLRLHTKPSPLDDEASLFDVNAICFRLADESLRGRDLEEATEVLQWMQFAEHELLPPVCSWVFPLIGVIQSEAKTVEKAKEECLRILKVIDDHLLFRTFILGHRITLADVTLFCNLTFLYQHVLSPAARRPFTCLNRWFKTLQQHPAFRQHVGHLEWCQAEAQPQASPKW